MTTRNHTTAEGMLAAVLGLMLIPMSVWLNGLAVRSFWNWLAVPAFNLPAITTAQAIIGAAVIGYTTYQYDGRIKDERSPWEILGNSIAWALLKPGFAFVVAWIMRGVLL